MLACVHAQALENSRLFFDGAETHLDVRKQLEDSGGLEQESMSSFSNSDESLKKYTGIKGSHFMVGPSD